jgi:hypothetical protein
VVPTSLYQRLFGRDLLRELLGKRGCSATVRSTAACSTGDLFDWRLLD